MIHSNPSWIRVATALLALAYLVGLAILLYRGVHAPWFLGLGLRGGQGVDFFCVPKAYLNLWDGKSAFDTWSSPLFGPHATWFVLHPAVAIWIGGPLSMLSPWISYGVFVAVTLVMLALAASMLSYHARTHRSKWLIWLLFFLSPLTYWLLFVGNVHGLVVLSASFVLVGLFELEDTDRGFALGLSPQAKVGAGLLISLLSKPVLLFLIPGLLLLHATRRATILAVTVYAVASTAFIVSPSLNPESVGIPRLMELLSSPNWVKANLNIYTNGFTVTRDMRDNAMHWLHMVAQSTYTWDHAQVFSLPVLLKGLTGKAYSLQSVVFLPALAALALPQITSTKDKLQYLTWLLVLTLSLHFAAYSISWEYQYTQLLVISAGCLSVINVGPLPRALSMLLAVALLTLQLPSPYVLVSANGLSSDGLILMRVFRLSPAIASAIAAAWMILSIVRNATNRKAASLPTTEMLRP